VSERRYLAVGFDMDGTLLRTDVDYVKLCTVVCNEMKVAGVPASILVMSKGSKQNLDDGMRYLIENGMSDAADAAFKRIREGVKKVELENVMTARPYEGGEMMLRYLKSKGYRIGVLTRGSRPYAEKALTVAGVIDDLDALVCRDDHPEPEAKPSPIAMRHLANELNVEPKDILYLGDHSMDHSCARDSGAGFIGVLTGSTEEYWKRIDENIRVIDTVTDLMKIL